MKNQLFRRNPDRYIINDLMMVFNIKSLDDENFHFTKEDLTNLDIVDKIEQMYLVQDGIWKDQFHTSIINNNNNLLPFLFPLLPKLT